MAVTVCLNLASRVLLTILLFSVSPHRRLSKRERMEDRQGVINEGFEMDPPKSPWRYPFSRTLSSGGRAPSRIKEFNRTLSQDSESSTCTGSSLGLSFLNKETLPQVHADPTASAKECF